MTDHQKIIFPTLPSSKHGKNKQKEIVPQEVFLTPAPIAIKESADIVTLNPPLRLSLGNNKSKSALRTIGEVAQILKVPVHVIRFWQARFNEIKPIMRDDGRRYYRPNDVAFLQGLSRLLYEEGYTIKGAHRLIRKKGTGFVRDKSEKEIAHHDDRLNQVLSSLIVDLQELQTRVKKLVA